MIRVENWAAGRPCGSRGVDVGARTHTKGNDACPAGPSLEGWLLDVLRGGRSRRRVRRGRSSNRGRFDSPALNGIRSFRRHTSDTDDDLSLFLSGGGQGISLQALATGRSKQQVNGTWTAHEILALRTEAAAC